MTRTVIATFPDGEAARRAAVALGRTELAAGPTRVQVMSGTSRPTARLELRVDVQDTPRAVALLRDHGADVSESPAADTAPEAGADDEPDQNTQGEHESPGLLAAWGIAVADAVTAPMAGVTASDALLPGRNTARSQGRQPDTVHASAKGGSRDKDRPSSGTGPVIMGTAPNRSRAGTGSGTHLSNTVAAGTASSIGRISDGPAGSSSREAAMAASEGRPGPGTPKRLLDQTGSRARKDALPSPDPTSRVRKARKEG